MEISTEAFWIFLASRRKLQSLKSVCQRIQKLRDGIRRVMAEQTEPATGVQAMRLNFQKRISASFDLPNIHSTRAPPQINNIRSNPNIRNVMSMIEGSLTPAAPPPPPPGQKPAVHPKPAVPDRNRRVSTGSFDNPSVDSEMKSGIGFKHTLINADFPKKDGNDLCNLPPPKYYRNRSATTGSTFAQPNESEDQLYEIADPLTANQPPRPASSEAQNPRKPSLPILNALTESDECYEIIDPSFTRGTLSSHHSPMAKPFIPEQEPSRPLPDDAAEYASIDSIVSKSPPLASSSKNPAPISRHYMHQQKSSSSTEDPSDSEHHESDPPSVSSNPILFPRAKLEPNFLSVAKGPIHKELPKVSSHDTTDELYETTHYIEPSNQNIHNVPVDKSPAVARNCEHGTVSETENLYDMPEDTSGNTQTKFGTNIQSSPANTHDGHLPPGCNVYDCSGDEKNLPPRLMGEKSSQATEIAFSNCVPKRRHLSPAVLLGPPPPKPPRPPSVNLQLIPSRCPPQHKSEPVGYGPDGTYECPLPSPKTPADEVYADCVSSQTDPDRNLYEISSDPRSGLAGEGYYETATVEAAVSRIRPPHPNGNGIVGGHRRSQSIEEPRFRDVKIEKSEQALREKYKITGSEIAIYPATVKKNVKGGKEALAMTQGDMVEIIQTMGCPAGKWLARNHRGNYGFVPLDAIGENQDILNVSSCGRSQSGSNDDEVVFGGTENHYSPFNDTEEPEGHSDDTDSNVSLPSSSSGSIGKTLKTFFKMKKDPVSSSPTNVSEDPYSSDILQDSCNKKSSAQSQVFAKEEKNFRDKFKYTADIKVQRTAIVTEGAAVSVKGKSGLKVTLGEKLEVIDVLTDNQIICRNSTGKFGLVSVEHLQFVNS